MDRRTFIDVYYVKSFLFDNKFFHSCSNVERWFQNKILGFEEGYFKVQLLPRQDYGLLPEKMYLLN